MLDSANLMLWPPFVDGDIVVLGIYLSRVFTHILPTLKKNSVLIPYEFEYTQLQDVELTPKQKSTFHQIDAELQEIG